MSSRNPQNGRQTSPTNNDSLEADIALLTHLLSQDLEEAGSDPVDVAELLRRIEAAEGLADGVEGRLDDIIGSLDILLSELETVQAQPGECQAGEHGSEAKGVAREGQFMEATAAATVDGENEGQENAPK